MIARAALHFYEEPCLSGKEGSGTVFFSGCNLKCVFCQNKEISRGAAGHAVSVRELADTFLKLQDMGANNINLVTPSHYYLQIKEALVLVCDELKIPVIANTSSYDSVSVLKQMEGLIDIYLADFKYITPEISKKYSGAADYPAVAKEAIDEMVRQVGTPVFDERGMMKRGVIVRNLLLPGHVKESKECIGYIYEKYGDKVYISVMNQFTPYKIPENFSELDRKVTPREYERLLKFVTELGITNAYIQEGDTAKESFIPEFEKNIKEG